MNDSLGSTLRRAREAAGLSLRAVSRMAGLSPAQLSQIEAGAAKTPGFQRVARIARVLHLPLDELADSLGIEAGPEELPSSPERRERIALQEIKELETEFQGRIKRVVDALRSSRSA